MAAGTTVPRGSLDTSKHRPRAIPRSMIGRIPFDIIGLSIGDMVSRGPQQVKTKMPTFNDQSLQLAGLPSMQLKFCWPGYEKYDFTETIPLAGKTNGQVALAVAGAFHEFFLKAARVPSSDPRFAITQGSPYSSLSNLYLRAVHHVYTDIFVAEIECIGRGGLMQ
ncbi:hypothetical protein BV20DRAFT_38352 [Pilatotrama ljubarskyi]|nr:hypothetical protein BV20DRAFT_38352 [Pilatotrama ljubarskyi]